MPFDTTPREHDTHATRPCWLAPLTMLVAWLVSLLNSITKLKRFRATTRFKPHWIDSWTDLRRLEWHRDQLWPKAQRFSLQARRWTMPRRPHRSAR